MRGDDQAPDKLRRSTRLDTAMKLNHAQWVEVLCTLMEAEGQPADTIAKMRTIGSTAGATADLKDFIHHALLSAKHYPAPVRAKLEELLRSKGLPPLSKLDTGILDTCLRILRRRRIRNDEE